MHIRTDNHQGYKDAITGFLLNSADYPFPVLDPKRVIDGADPQHHGAPGLREGRADDDLQVDRGDLAAGDRLIPSTLATPGPGGWRFAPAGAPVPHQDPERARIASPS